MKRFPIPILVIFITFYFISGTAKGQSKTEYFMQSSFERGSLNPALRPNQGYMVLPVLPSFYGEVRTNTLNLDHLTRKAGGERVTFLHQSVDTDDFLHRMKNNNYVIGTVSYKLFGLGFYRNDDFWSIDLDIKTHVDANIPKSVFELVKKGFGRQEQTKYEIENIRATGNGKLELGVGYSRPLINDNLIVGGRMKGLIGIADFNLNASRLTIDAGTEYWEAQSSVLLKASMPGIKVKHDEEGKFDGFELSEGKRISATGWGAGFDIGAQYDLSEIFPRLNGLTVSAALTDIGFIRFGRKNTVFLESPETTVRINPNDYTLHTDGSSSLNDVFEDVVEDLQSAVDLQETEPVKRTVPLRSSLNIGTEYRMNERLSFGVLFSNYFGTYFNSPELTVSANFVHAGWLGLTGSYSVMHSAFNTLGFAAHLAPPKGIRFFLASDYIFPHVNSHFFPTKSKALNVQVGFSIPMGEKLYPHKPAL